MGQKKRSQKGEISIINCEGRIRLRWRYQGERYSLNLPYPYSLENLASASVTSAEIKLDMIKGCFDYTLKKYDSTPLIPSSPAITLIEPAKNPIELPSEVNLVEKFNGWVKNIRNVDVDNTNYYLSVRKLLQKWINISNVEIPEKLNDENLAVCTYNDRLSVLKSFFTWLLDSGFIEKNPLKDVRRKRIKLKTRLKAQTGPSGRI